MGSKRGRRIVITSQAGTPALSITNVSTTGLTLNWTNSESGATYIVQRATSADYSVNLTTVFTGILLTVNDSGLSPLTTYYYRIKAVKVGKLDSNYGFANQTTLNAGGGGGGVQLSTPSVARLGYGLTSISLTFGAVIGATDYKIERATNSTFTTGLTTLYNGNASSLVRQYQQGFTLEYHDTGRSANVTYYYRVQAIDISGVNSVSNYGIVTITTGSANKTANYSAANIFIGATGGSFDYWTGSAIVQVHGGDTVTLSGTSLTYWSISGVNGTPTEPISIRNQGDPEMFNGISLENSSYLNAVFNHVSKTLPEGISVYAHHNGAACNIFGLSHHIRVSQMFTKGCNYAVWCKNELVTYSSNGDCGAIYWWPSRITDIEIDNFTSEDHGQDGMYFNSSGEWAGSRQITCGGTVISPRPSSSANIHVHHNTLRRIARSGLQCGGMDAGTNSIHDNNVTEIGWEFVDNQGTGIGFGGSVGDVEVYNNYVRRTFLHNVYSYSHGLFYYHNNDTADNAVTVDPSHPYSYMEIALSGGQTISNVWNGHSFIRIGEPNGEYLFEYFFNNGSNPQLKLQRLNDTLSASKITIPTSHPTTLTFQCRDSDRSYPVGSTMRIFAAGQNGTIWIEGTVQTYSGGVLTITTTGNTGTGTYRLWNIFKHSRTPQAAIQAVSTTAPGVHAGTANDPYAGFGASSTINAGQVTFMSEVWIPSTSAQSNLMLNAFSNNPVNVYGNPAGLKRFRIENNVFGIQKAAASSVIVFNNTTNWYDTTYANTICGNTYLGSALIEGNINKPGGGVVTYTLSNTC